MLLSSAGSLSQCEGVVEDVEVVAGAEDGKVMVAFPAMLNDAMVSRGWTKENSAIVVNKWREDGLQEVCDWTGSGGGGVWCAVCREVGCRRRREKPRERRRQKHSKHATRLKARLYIHSTRFLGGEFAGSRLHVFDVYLSSQRDRPTSPYQRALEVLS